MDESVFMRKVLTCMQDKHVSSHTHAHSTTCSLQKVQEEQRKNGNRGQEDRVSSSEVALQLNSF